MELETLVKIGIGLEFALFIIGAIIIYRDIIKKYRS